MGGKHFHYELDDKPVWTQRVSYFGLAFFVQKYSVSHFSDDWAQIMFYKPLRLMIEIAPTWVRVYKYKNTMSNYSGIR